VKALVRYHEIALKGGNRPFFLARLRRNLATATADLGAARVVDQGGRVLVELPDGAGEERARERLGSVFGVANFSFVQDCPPEMAALEAAVLRRLPGMSFRSFLVRARRSHKAFPLTSTEIERRLGALVQGATGARVDLERGEMTLLVEVLADRIYLSFGKEAGAGGLPVGSAGKVLALLSGGIDSPVAAARMMRRGCTVALAHFHAFPLLDRTTIDKTRELARRLARFQYRSRLLQVPFAPVQQAIVASCPAPLRVVLYRRCMVRIAEALADRLSAKALVTGESLGQVASQTLDNLSAIDAVARRPVLRPLVGMDKMEITEEARRLGTFEISIVPDQDCCQLFVPRSPATSARLADLEAAEKGLDVDALVRGALVAVTEERIEFPLATAWTEGATERGGERRRAVSPGSRML
jgi:thiamine biosynthesis protein ThiI